MDAIVTYRNLNTPITIEIEGDWAFLHFRFKPELIDRIKLMDGASWQSEMRCWKIRYNERNIFQLRFLIGKNPYAPYEVAYESKADEIKARFPYLRQHQAVMVAQFQATQRVIWGAEMGLGKTLCDFVAIDLFAEKYGLEKNENTIWFAATKSALTSIYLELQKWNITWRPRLLTYEGLTKAVNNWESGKLPPNLLVLDECQKIKNAKSLRTQACHHLLLSMRVDHKEKMGCILQSGTPSPLNPTDWWAVTEGVEPGFVAEGTPEKLKSTLAVIRFDENNIGKKYPVVVCWKDGTQGLCNVCGCQMKHINHVPRATPMSHPFEPLKDEVTRLYKRMRGLVHITMKKDCLDLPDKIYRVIKLEPTPAVANAIRYIERISPTALAKKERMKELSDGFSYTYIESKEKHVCPNCGGKKTETVLYDQVLGDIVTEMGENVIEEQMTCGLCNGTGEVGKEERETKYLGTPKEQAVADLLEEHEDVGRFVIFAAFSASLDIIEKVCMTNGWTTIKVGGGKVSVRNEKGIDVALGGDGDPLTKAVREFQDPKSKIEKMAFVCTTSSGSTGLTLTRSPSALFYSNMEAGEHRTQAEDRIHRLGMDANKGATIIDFDYLSTDRDTLASLQEKRRLELLSMGQVQNAVKADN